MSADPGQDGLPSASRTVEPGKLGRYALVRKIATGGMAELFLARREGPQGFAKTVVVKRLLPHLASDPDTVRMFLNEARLAGLISHPNVISVFDVDTEDDIGEHYIAMEFLDGSNLLRLQKELPDETTVAPEVWAGIIREVCSGLHHAHELVDENGRPLHLVHRDVSLDNIVVTYDGQVKLVDFGIAKTELLDGTTRKGQLKGKFGYMAPEVFEGQPLDRRTDLWAIGVTLYRLLTGVRPFGGRNAAEIMHRVLHVDPRPIVALAPACPVELASIVDRCLQKDPSARYQTAAELRDDLETWLAKRGASVGREELALLVLSRFPRSTSADLPPTLADTHTHKAIPSNLHASALRRLLSYLLDLGGALLVFLYTYDRAPWAGFAALLGATALALVLWRATIGQVLVGVELMPLDPSASTWERGLLRFLLQHGWILIAGCFISAAYESSRTAETLGMLAVAGAAVSWLGSIGALTRSAQGLHDRLAGLRVVRRLAE